MLSLGLAEPSIEVVPSDDLPVTPPGVALARDKRFRKEIFKSLMLLGGTGSVGEISYYLKLSEVTCRQLRDAVQVLVREGFLAEGPISESSGPTYRFNT